MGGAQHGLTASTNGGIPGSGHASYVTTTLHCSLALFARHPHSTVRGSGHLPCHRFYRLFSISSKLEFVSVNKIYFNDLLCICCKDLILQNFK